MSDTNIVEVQPRSIRFAIIISASYFVIGCIWILLSDTILSYALSTKSELSQAQTVKGWIFITFTTGLLFFSVIYFLKQWSRQFELNQIAATRLSSADQKFRRVVEAAMDGVWISNEAGVSIFVNQRTADILGCSIHELIGREFFDFVDDNYSGQCRIYIKRTKDGIRETHETKLKYKSGGFVWALISISSLKDEVGRFIGGVIMITDISSRKQSEDAISAEKQFFQSTLDGLTAHICVVEDTGEIISVNKAWVAFGIDNNISASFIECGSNYFDVLSRTLGPEKVDAELFLKRLKSVLSGETPYFEMEYPCHSPSKQRWFVARVSALKSINSRRVIVSHEDITPQKLAELRLRRNAAALEAAANGIVITDREGFIQWVNPAFTALSGYTFEEVAGKRPNILKSDRQDPTEYQKLWNTVLSGRVWHGILINRRKNGNEYHEEQTITPVLTTSGELEGFISIKQDITTRLKAEQDLHSLNITLEQRVTERTSELEAARDLLEAVVKSILYGLLFVDNERRVQLFNQSAEQLFKTQGDLIAGLSLNEVSDRSPLQEKLLEALLTPQTRVKFDSLVGDQMICVQTSPVCDKTGRLNGVLAIFEDVTEVRKIDRMKSEFLSTAAHELRTPLTSILGFSEILLTRKMSDEKLQSILTIINRQAQNLGDIINDLLDLVRIESGRGLELKRDSTDLVKIASDVIEIFKSRALQHTFVLETSAPIILVHCDRVRIQQALLNLVSNATKYSPKGGVVTIQLSVTKFHFICKVKDEGLGMSDEQLSHVFEKFYRANAGNTSIGGTGLGLSIVRATIEQHGGKVQIESALGHGTCVIFSLPCGIGSSQMPAVKSSRDSSRITQSSAKRILVLEGDPGVASMIEFYLKEVGYSVGLVESGAQFAERVATEMPDLVSLESILPDALGMEIFKELKRDPRTTNIPVIFISTRESEKAEALANGARAYIFKPFERSDLLSTVSAILDHPKDEPMLP